MKIWPIVAALALGRGTGEELKVRLVWGQASPAGTPFTVKIAPSGPGVAILKDEGLLGRDRTAGPGAGNVGAGP